jgi:hypothetical protein
VAFGLNPTRQLVYRPEISKAVGTVYRPESNKISDNGPETNKAAGI